MGKVTKLLGTLAEEYGDDVVRTVRRVLGDAAQPEQIEAAVKRTAKPAAPAVIRNRSGTPAAVARDVLSEAGQKGKGRQSYSAWRRANPGHGVLFDTSKLDRVPDRPQYQIPRRNPPRGPSDRIVDALNDPAVARGINETVERGIEGGGKAWYNTDPVYRRMGSLMPSVDVDPAYARFMDIMAATSPRSKVPDNIRTGIYYNYLRANGLPIEEKPAKGFGSVAQNLHRDNVRRLEDLGGWDVFRNPKPASFSSNLQGNQQVATIDTHNFRLPGILSGDPRFLETSISELAESRQAGLDTLRRHYPNLSDEALNSAVHPRKGGGITVSYRPQEWVGKGYVSPEEVRSDPASWAAKPRDNEYGYYEKWQQDQAADMGLSPAQYQASMWLGGGEDTGLGSAAEPFIGTLEARVRYTADRLGMDPERVLDMMLRGEIPLLAEGGSVDKDALFAKYA